MKKILAIALAIVMLFAVCVPAFAAELNKDKTTDSPRVYTKIDAVAGGTWTVAYPAEMPVDWGTEATEFEYSITSQLEAGYRVKVDVAADHDVMTLTGGTDTLAYAISGETAATSADEVVTAEAHKISVDIAKAAWSAAAIGVYEDTVTFTAGVVAA